MRWLVAMWIGTGAPAMAQECPTIGGIDAVVRPGAVLALGQLYGTAESPAFVLDAACHAAAAGIPVVVGLELPAGERGRIDVFLDSTGAPEDREALISGPPWQSDPQDGRTSFAMLELIDGLRRLRADGKAIRVVPFGTEGADDDPAHEDGMRQALAATAEATPDSMVIVLIGKKRGGFPQGREGNGDDRPVASLPTWLLEGDVIALDVAHGPGSAWDCSSGCGPVEVLGTEGDWRWTIRIDETPTPDGHHGRYFVGDVTASPPARGGAATVPVDETPWAGRRTGWTPDDWSPPPAPPRATGELTAAEKLFQGSWQSYLYESGKRSWKMRFQGRGFHADGGGGPDEFYAGYVSIRPGTSPAQIDFTIEECDCDYEGSTSRGIYYEDGESIVLAAPPPGTPRAASFEQEDQMLRLRRPEPTDGSERASP